MNRSRVMSRLPNRSKPFISSFSLAKQEIQNTSTHTIEYGRLTIDFSGFEEKMVTRIGEPSGMGDGGDQGV